MNKSLLFLSLVLALTVIGCKSANRTVFSQRLYKESGLSSADLKKVQFYVDRDIVLQRSVDQGSTGVKDGDIIFRGGRKVQEVVIRTGTPGVLTFMPKDDRLGISFDAKNSTHYLMFGPNPKSRNRYTLLANEWKENYGVVTYGDEKWTVSAADAGATLLVNLSDKRSRSVKSKVEQGRTVK